MGKIRMVVSATEYKAGGVGGSRELSPKRGGEA